VSIASNFFQVIILIDLRLPKMAKNINYTTNTREVSPTSSNAGENLAATPKSASNAFFPWLEVDDDETRMSILSLKYFPKMGAIGIIGSALTTVLSWGVLRTFQDRIIVDLPHFLPKPASWLSIILSLNSILVHMAVSHGMAVAWWYRASKKTTTVKDLHETWAVGGSITEAILSWKTLNYIGLATIFAATLPINGILLQNSMDVGSVDIFDTEADWFKYDFLTLFPSFFFSGEKCPRRGLGGFKTCFP
jgi:hypothetical protein